MDPQTAASHLSSFTAYLTIAIHTLLHARSLYPPTSFISTRAYDLPVWQSRHPAVCSWVRDAVAAVAVQLRAAAVRRLFFCLHAAGGRDVLERWVWDLVGFPDAVVHLEGGSGGDAGWTDAREAWRGALLALEMRADMLPPPPLETTFSLAVELKDQADAPTQHPRLWIPSEPHLQPSSGLSGPAPGTTTVPVRSVQAGPLFFDCWLEQAQRRAPDDES
ncbi:mitotic spindle assembly checkpoint protein mad2 [Ophiocordyceps camponoti-floridani]|uniref:Mitotic spindle assembly checkpoint protein mad2 n=1 Tax=Ophiocordyceps camponoti-floridani TaxID=2030778 RepID=A0A8H4Q7J8_9HYPO|nr:mitotic spindle assembly checkpoint protein mad2 [Ophiocordyceps camponoti-floridani]